MLYHLLAALCRVAFGALELVLQSTLAPAGLASLEAGETMLREFFDDCHRRLGFCGAAMDRMAGAGSRVRQLLTLHSLGTDELIEMQQRHALAKDALEGLTEAAQTPLREKHDEKTKNIVAVLGTRGVANPESGSPTKKRPGIRLDFGKAARTLGKTTSHEK